MKSNKKQKLQALLNRLDQHYPQSACTLDYRSPFQLLVATVLSAQCTDRRVNQITATLFDRYPDPKTMAAAPVAELENAIRTAGLFRIKARNLKAASRQLLEQHQGEVPRDRRALMKLPGVGRKTANVIIGNAFAIPALAVDTHVARIARRLGLTSQSDPLKVEKDLMELLPERRWTRFSHQLIEHGRKLCHARQPKCQDCPLRPCCSFAHR